MRCGDIPEAFGKFARKVMRQSDLISCKQRKPSQKNDHWIEVADDLNSALRAVKATEDLLRSDTRYSGPYSLAQVLYVDIVNTLGYFYDQSVEESALLSSVILEEQTDARYFCSDSLSVADPRLRNAFLISDPGISAPVVSTCDTTTLAELDDDVKNI